MLICILLLNSLSPVTTSAQDYRILHWGIENGLSQGINQKIIQDSEGFLWVTSYEGVNRFDGKTFRNFYSYPKKRNAITGIETTGLVEDSLQKIWIGSGYGLNCYDPVTDSVTIFSPPQQLANHSHYIIPVVATKDEVICFDNAGKLIGYNCKTFSQRVITENIKWYDDYINVNNSWFDKKNNTIWMPAESGIAKIEVTTGKTEYYFSSEQINAIVYDERTSLAILGTDDGIIEWNISSNSSHSIKTLQSIALGKIICMATDKAFNRWIGTEEHGLFIIGSGDTITQMTKNTEQQNTINGNKINTIYCDHAGIVWIGVSTNGINQLIPGNRFTHYSENIKTKNTLTNNIVRSFIEDHSKNIWIATQGGGINIFSPYLRSFSSLTKKNTPGLPFDFIRCIVKDENNVAWVGTEKGMCRIGMQSLKTDKIFFTRPDNEPLPDLYIERIIAFENDSWLIASKKFGLFQLKKDSTIARQLSWPGDKHVFYTAFVNHLLFVSVWDDDPKVFRIENGQWKELKKNITSFLITDLLYDKFQKKYWIGTMKGLLEADEKLNIIHQYTTDDGLSNNYIYALILDHQGLLWVSTNKGLSQFNTHTRTFKVFTPADGLQGYEYNGRAGFISSDSDLYFGGINGFDIIKNINNSFRDEPAEFYIKECLVNNKLFTDKGDINHVSAIKLHYSDNNITIRTGIVDFNASGNSKIKYKLEGSDADWRTADRDFVINYSGLQPGNYTFVATAANANNEWNEKVTTLTITIAAPFWQAWWFISLCVMAAASIVYGIYKYRINQLKKLLAIRTKISQDLHDEVGSTLTSINILSKVSQSNFEKDKSKASELMQKITEQSANMQQSMSDIVWSIKPDNDKIENLIIRMREYLGQTAEPKNMQVEFSADEKVLKESLNMQHRQHVFLIFKEAVNNAVKYSQGKKLSVFLDKENHHIKLSVADDGVGFDPEKITSSNGLKNMHDRARVLKGTLHIQSSPGKGAKVELLCPTT